MIIATIKMTKSGIKTLIAMSCALVSELKGPSGTFVCVLIGIDSMYSVIVSCICTLST